MGQHKGIGLNLSFMDLGWGSYPTLLSFLHENNRFNLELISIPKTSK